MEKVEKKRSTYDYKPVCENEKPASENRESQLDETTMQTPLKTQLSKICWLTIHIHTIYSKKKKETNC